jgi:AAA domain
MKLQDVPSEEPCQVVFEALTPNELRNRGNPSPGWVWDGYLGRGMVTLLTSLWKCGKTTLLSILVKRMSAGGTVAGRSIRAGRVAVLSEEEPQLWDGRCEQLGIGPHARFLCRPFRGRRPTPSEWRAMVKFLVARRHAEGLDLVVIDALAAFLPGRTENDAGTVLQMLLTLQDLTALGVAVLILHHPKKGTVLAGQAARGSGALGGNADIIIEMDGISGPTEDDRRRRLAAFSRYADTPRRLVIEWSADGTDYTALGDFNAPELDDTWQVLFWVLEDASGKLTRDDILRQWPADYRKPDKCTVGRWLNRAVKDGRVLQAGTGHKNDPFVYWLDGMEDVWKSNPFYLEPMRPVEEELGIRPQKTLAEVLAERKAVGDGTVERNTRTTAARRRASG